MPVVIRRFHKDNTLVTGDNRLMRATEFKAKQYRQRFFKPNPYLTVNRTLDRENLPQDDN
jgi:hypothetical protein